LYLQIVAGDIILRNVYLKDKAVVSIILLILLLILTTEN